MMVKKSIHFLCFVMMFFIFSVTPGFSEQNSNISSNSVLGSDWKCVTTKAGFPPRSGQAAVVFNNRMWIIGGETNGWNNRIFDVWNSTDGTNWTCVTTNAPLAFVVPGCVVFNNKIWWFGWSASDSSSDGKNWNHNNESFNYDQISAVSFKNNMWLIGGGNGKYSTNAVWYSHDGINFKCVNRAAPFGPGGSMAVAEFKNSIWVLGTNATIWSSGDGTNWSFSGYSLPSNVWQGQMFSSGGKLYLICNSGVYDSEDGTNWNCITSTPQWLILPGGERQGYSTLFFNNAIWIIGGSTNNWQGSLNDVWVSQ